MWNDGNDKPELSKQGFAAYRHPDVVQAPFEPDSVIFNGGFNNNIASQNFKSDDSSYGFCSQMPIIDSWEGEVHNSNRSFTCASEPSSTQYHHEQWSDNDMPRSFANGKHGRIYIGGKSDKKLVSGRVLHRDFKPY